MNAKVSMVLIGLGRIGYKGFPQTHYECAIRNNLNVVAGVDSSTEVRAAFTAETGIPSYASLDELSEDYWPSFYSVATSSDVSFKILKDLLTRKGPLGIITEKPFCSDSIESREVLNLQKIVQTPLRINYARQYAQAMATVKSLVASNKLVSGVVIYSSGLRENGSHFIRLICGLFPLMDFPRDVVWKDRTSFQLYANNEAVINFVPLDSPHLHNSEIRLIFEEITISISEGYKIEIRKINIKSQMRNWPRELELVLDTNFSDGFESSYLDQKWWRFPNQALISKELKLDHLCNVLIDTAPSRNSKTIEED